jgi:predicted PurR-regulated permease PerM
MTEPASTPGARSRLRPLLILIAIVFALGLLVFHHFLLVFAVAGPFAMFLAPAHRALTRLLRGYGAVAAGLIVLVCVVAILLPVLTSATLLSRQAVDFFEWARPRLQPEEVQKLWTETLPQRHPWLRTFFDFDEQELTRVVSEGLTRGVAGLNRVIQSTAAGLTSAFFDLVLFVLMLFFLLRDGPQLRREIDTMSPLSKVQEDEIFDQLTRTVNGVLRAMVVVPLVQGMVALPAFLIFGVPAPLLWSVMVVLAALVPIVGSPLGWLPACAYLFFNAEPWQWIGLLVYGVVIISGIDNVIKPVLLRDAARIHPMLGFLSIVGGVLSFGPMGVFVGPVILSLVLSGLRIYKADVLHVRPAETPAIAAST